MNIFWIGWVIFAFVILLAVFVPEIWTKMHYKKRDKERAERKKQANDKLAERFPLAIAEMKKKWKDITLDKIRKNAFYGTNCEFAYKGFFFHLFVNNLDLVEIDRNCEEVGTIAYDDVDHYIKVFGILFNEVDGVVEKLERVANRLVDKLVDLHAGGQEWKLVKDMDHGIERIKVLERLEHRLILNVQESQISATIIKDEKVWANFKIDIKDGIDHFDAVNKVFEKVVQWEDFM